MWQRFALNLFLFVCLNPFFLHGSSNPFEICFPEKIELTTEDYIEVQDRLRKIDINPILHQIYPAPIPLGFTSYGDYWVRCSRCLRQVLIDPDKGWYPEKELRQVGKGGDSCIVSCVSFETPYAGRPDLTTKLSETIYDALEKAGYNGFLLQLKGGYPNPTGIEIRYAGVPYAFKIFMMLEAFKLGFSKVLWIDSACLPINDPTELFDILEDHGAVFLSFRTEHHAENYILPFTHQLLYDLTGTNVLSANYVCTIVFGLKMDSEEGRKLVEEYYNMVKLGEPFLSCFPEEFVLTSILGEPDMKHLHFCPKYDHLFIRSERGKKDSSELFNAAKKEGYFFYQRQH